MWDYIKKAVGARRVVGTCRRVNPRPDAPRDPTGRFLQQRLPSDLVRDGPIYDLCKAMNPDFEFDAVQVNKFTAPDQCQMHKDSKNRGQSRWALLGNCTGGGLILEDGRHFKQKRRWRE